MAEQADATDLKSVEFYTRASSSLATRKHNLKNYAKYAGMAESADASDLKSAGFQHPWGFKSPYPHNKGVQLSWLEHAAHNGTVLGSSPRTPIPLKGTSSNSFFNDNYKRKKWCFVRLKSMKVEVWSNAVVSLNISIIDQFLD